MIERSMRKTLLVIIVMLLSIVQAGDLKKAETEHFTLVFSEDSLSTARYLFSVMEECYDELTGFFGEDPHLSMPVYIKEDENSFNAYFTSFPSNHIVIYSAYIPESLSFGSETLKLVFLHELTHAFTFSFRGTLGKITSTVFGDGADLANLLHFLYFLQEGIAVYTESRNRNGRLSDPFMLSSITEAVSEGIDVSYMDASGGRDIKPYGDLGYIYGGAFLRHAAEKYGEARLAEFFVKISKGVFSFPQNTWTDMFCKTLWDEWKDFMASVTPPGDIRFPITVRTGMRYVTDLASDGRDVFHVSPSSSAVIRLSDGKTLKTLPGAGHLSSSDEYLTLSYSAGELQYTLLLDTDGNRKECFDGYHMGTHLSGSGHLLLVRSSDLSTFIDITDLHGNVQKTISIGRASLTALSPSGHAIIDGNICQIDSETGNITVYTVPDDVLISSLSASGDKLSFSYVMGSDVWTLPRYGEFENGTYRLYGSFFLGGVNNPVRIGDDVYFTSDFFDAAAVSRENISQFGNAGTYETCSYSFIPESFTEEQTSYVNYVPILSLLRGTFFPLALGSSGNLTLAGPGLTWVTMDASEELTLLFSLGWAPTDRWFAAAGMSYRDFGVRGTAGLKDGRTDFDVSLSYTPTIHFSYLTRTLSLSETVKYSSGQNRFSNELSVTYSDRVKKGAHRYHVAGYSVGLTLNGLTPMIGGTIFIPSLFPEGRTDRPDFSMPAAISMTYDPNAVKLKSSLSVRLMTAEIQTPVRFLCLYMNSFSLKATGEVTTHISGVSGYRISLDAAFLLSPVLGTLSSMQWELGARLSYEGSVSFSLIFTPI